MSDAETLSIESSRYFGAPPVRLKPEVGITVVERAFPPYLGDLRQDWVASVAIPAFRAVERERAGRVRAFCSIGTGTGLDALGAIEVFGPDLVGITDVHEEVVAAAARNVTANLKGGAVPRLLSGTGDLLSPLAGAAPKFDVIYENLPNVPLALAGSVERQRVSSSFFPPRAEPVPEVLRRQLLALHHVALGQARRFLAEDGLVLSMLGGRVPLRYFLEMAELAGYRASFLAYGWKIQAEAEAVISGHVAWEAQGFGPFHFYEEAALADAFAGLDPQAAGEQALEIEKSLERWKLDAGAALAAITRGERVAHTYAVLKSSL